MTMYKVPPLFLAKIEETREDGFDCYMCSGVGRVPQSGFITRNTSTCWMCGGRGREPCHLCEELAVYKTEQGLYFCKQCYFWHSGWQEEHG